MKKISLMPLLMFVMLFSGFVTYSNNDPAASGKISGYVVDNIHSKAVEYANIVLKREADSSIVNGTISTAGGQFLIEKVPFGNFFLEIDFIGFEKYVIRNIEVKKENRKVELGKISLRISTKDIEEVEVTVEKDAIQYKIDKKVVNVSKNQNAAGGNIAEALENTPSIQVDQEGNVTLRGSSNFTVLIDGKQTALAANDALKQIPAAAVENVEIITNPSVKYDPDGTSGIINIIMKKGYKTGLNGIVNASIGTGYKYSGDFTLNYRTNKVNWFASGNYRDNPNLPKTTLSSEIKFNDTLRIVDQVADREQNHKSYNVKGGADFYIDDSNTLTLSGEYGYWGFLMGSNSDVSEFTEPVSTENFFLTETALDIGGNYANGSLTYEHQFSKGHNIVSTFTYSDWRGKTSTDVSEQYTDNNWENVFNANHSLSEQTNNNNDIRFKIDYTLPLSKMSKLETGYQTRMKTVDNSFQISNQDYDTKTWTVNDYYTTAFDFSRDIHSAYATYSNVFKGFQFQFGLRGEYTDRSLIPENSTEKYVVNRFDFFPSAHITRQLPKEQQLQASYSRRVNRPEPWVLNPNPIYSDSYVRRSGNPALLPEFTDSYELNYMKRLKTGFFSAEAYFRQTNNSFTRTMNIDNEGLVVIKTENLDRNYALGGELSANLRFLKIINVYASANVYSTKIVGDIVSEGVDTQSLNTDFSLNSTFMFTKTTRLQLTGFYRAPTLTAQGYRSDMYGVNASIKQEFFKKKLSVTLQGRNILNTMHFEFVAETPEMNSKFTWEPEYPVITLSLSYRINNYKKRQEDPDSQPNVGGGGGMM